MEQDSEKEESELFTKDESEKYINIAAFVVFSFVPYSLFYVAMSSAEDVLVETDTPTSVVYLCGITPYFLGTLILPIVEDKIPCLFTMMLTFGFDAFGIIFLSVLRRRDLKLLGIGFISLANAFADVGFLSSTALYGEVTVKAYATGTGVGFAVAVIYYAGATTWFCVSMDNTLMMITWLPLLLPMFYCLMDKNSGDERLVAKPTSYEGVPYSPINPESQENQDEQLHLTYRDKLTVVRNQMLLCISFFAGEFGKFFLMQAVVTTLAFANAPFAPRDHYQYYVFAIMLGDLFGTSYGLIMYCAKCNLPSHTRHTWIFSSLIMSSVFFLICAAWFRFLPNVWIALLVSFFVGLSEGVLYNCTFASAASVNSSVAHKGFSRAFLTAGMGLGILCASLLGLYVEPILEEHCFHISKDTTSCLTRMMSNAKNGCFSG